MTDPKELARLALTVGVVKAKINAADTALRQQLAAVLDPSERIPGRIGDAKIGSASKTDPKPAARITNGEAFRAWVKDNRPEEIVTVEAVNSAFERALLKLYTECGGMPNDDGEVFEVPGVSIVPGVPIVRVVPDDGAEQIIAAAMAEDGLTLAQLLDAADRAQIEAS